MRLQKLIVVSSLTLVSIFTLVGCGSTSQSQTPTDTARIMSKDVVSTADSSMAIDIVSAQAITNTMEGLYRYQGKKLEPAIATKVVQPTNNGLTYTFPLRKNAKWSNGDPVTAQNFVFAWRRTVAPKTKSQMLTSMKVLPMLRILLKEKSQLIL
nr:ABC transporter substrate-binding protein [Bombilactobacillus bombi]